MTHTDGEGQSLKQGTLRLINFTLTMLSSSTGSPLRVHAGAI